MVFSWESTMALTAHFPSTIPSALFCSGMHEDLYQPTDHPDKIEYDKMQCMAQLVYEIVKNLGNGELN